MAEKSSILEHNIETLLNFAHVKDYEIYLYDENGDDIPLAQYVANHCELHCTAEDILNDGCQDCMLCVGGILNIVAIQAAEIKIRYEKIAAENAALHERLEKAVELPKLGDKVCRFYRRQESGEIWILEGKVIKVEINKNGTLIYIANLPSFYLTKSMIGNLKNEYIDLEAYYFCPKEAAEAKLKELQGAEE